MNTAEIAGRLRGALEVTGRTAFELSRRSNVKLRLVEQLLNGSGMVPIEAVIRVADGLELDVTLAPPPPRVRPTEPVESVVGGVLRDLASGSSASANAATLVAPSDKLSSQDVDAFIAAERERLDRLQSFARSPAFSELLEKVQDLTGQSDPGAVGEWLVRPAASLREFPIDLVHQVGGLEVIKTHLCRAILGIGV